MNKHKKAVSEHLVIRFRERWPGTEHLDDRQITNLALSQVKAGERRGDYVRTPGGTYFPFSLEGKDGYVVVSDKDKLVTVLPEEYCEEVNAFRKENGARNG